MNLIASIAALTVLLPALGQAASLETQWNDASVGFYQAPQRSQFKAHQISGRMPQAFVKDAFEGLEECRVVDASYFRQPTLEESETYLARCMEAVSSKYQARVSAQVNKVNERDWGLILLIDPRSSGNQALINDLVFALSKRGDQLFGHPAKVVPAFEKVAGSDASAGEVFTTGLKGNVNLVGQGPSKPLAGAVIKIWKDRQPVAVLQTDANGEFVARLAPGEYTVTPSADVNACAASRLVRVFPNRMSRMIIEFHWGCPR
ncbi:MAG: hypothetical protein HY078_13860 [Elusimicrobia bacterium]|nr:hypothetical protein [Elusimicrobiota bacterium]